MATTHLDGHMPPGAIACRERLGDYSSTTSALRHEYFGQAASIKRPMSDEFFHYMPLFSSTTNEQEADQN
jgi:hypothetical protein